MPSFLRTLPRGFSAAIAQLDRVDSTQQRAYAESALIKLAGNERFASHAVPELDPAEEKRLLEALDVLYQAAELGKVTPEDFYSEVSLLTPLEDATARLLAKLWGQRAKYAAPLPATADADDEGAFGQAMAPGTLLGMDWVLGLAMSSSNCDSLQQPFVGLNLRVTKGDGSVGTEALELTIADFRKLKMHVEEIARALERS